MRHIVRVHRRLLKQRGVELVVLTTGGEEAEVRVAQFLAQERGMRLRAVVGQTRLGPRRCRLVELCVGVEDGGVGYAVGRVCLALLLLLLGAQEGTGADGVEVLILRGL